MKDFDISLSLEEGVKKLDDGIVKGSVTGIRLDYHLIKFDDNQASITLVYEKHYIRAGNRLTLTVTLDNSKGVTHVHCIGGGGGEGLFKFDWGASESFGSAPKEILKDYII